jgi:parallel beta-helix repeat protein
MMPNEIFITQGYVMKLKNRKASQCMFAAIILTSSLASAAPVQAHLGSIVVDDNYVTQNGNVITGSFQGTVTTPAISITTTKPIIIQNSTVTGPGDLIYGNRANVTVINTVGLGTNPNQLNVQKGMFVHIENAINVLVQNCSIYQTRFAVYVHNYVGNYTSSQTIKVLKNAIWNIDARPSDGNGGYATSGSYNGHGIQLNFIQNVPNMEIGNNKMINFPLQSQVMENVNIYESSGTPTSHLLIHDNFMQGAYPTQIGVDSYSGGGIVLDGKKTDTAATATAFTDMYNNTVVSTANTGISIAAGHDNTAYNNTIVSSGYTSYCLFATRKGAVGMYNWNLYSQTADVFFNNHIHDNTIGLVSNDGTGLPMRNDWWLPGQNNNAENNAHWMPNNAQNPTVTDENNLNPAWLHTMRVANLKIGASDTSHDPLQTEIDRSCKSRKMK